MKKYILTILIALAAIITSIANDGVYFTSGNFLVPLQETDISVSKEILTITIGKDGFAKVDVYYEFNNKGQAKNVTMAFEAASPYNSCAPLDHQGKHPDIKDFTVNMNGVSLSHSNAVVACRYTQEGEQVDFTPLDLTKWKGFGEVADSILPAENAIYNPELDSISSFAYAYYFDAPFKEGINKVHHTYQYRMSYNVSQKFTIPYWLTPAMRWANHQVDDFTLRIASEEPTEFCLTDTLFTSAPFFSTQKTPIYHFKDAYERHSILAELSPNDTIVWHGKDFKPKADISIEAPLWSMDSVMNKWSASDWVIITADKHVYKYIGECDDKFLVKKNNYQLVAQEGSKKTLYCAEEGHGRVFVDTEEATMVNVRKLPSTKSTILGTISSGNHPQIGNEAKKPATYPCLGLVDALDRHSEEITKWYKIKYKGRVGYVSQKVTRWNAF